MIASCEAITAINSENSLIWPSRSDTSVERSRVSLENRISLDENGNSVDNYVWTGTKKNGELNTQTENCDDWTASTSNFGKVGHTVDGSGGDWSTWGNGRCYYDYSIYCFEQ